MRADILIDTLYKEASKAISDTIREETDDIAFHASPVQDIKKFRRSEDTSGNNKGKVVFVSRDPSFSAAFGIKWNDANARLVVETTNNKPPTNSNYKRTVLKVSEDVNIDAPCSMYKLRGDFKPLRCEDDIEEYTDKDVEIVSEEQFKSFKDMAEFYGLDLEKISKKQIMKEMEGKKTSNFEKGASETIDSLYKEAITDEYKNADKNQKQTMLKKMTQDAFDGNIPETNVITEKDINVFRPWFVHPWNDSKRVIVKLKDENNETIMPVDMDSSIFATDGVGFTIKEKRPIPFIPKENKHYSVMVDSIYLPEKNQRKGIGSASLKAVEDVANNLGISKIELIPDEKGPLVWGKPQFGYNITHDNGLKQIQKYYKKYAKKHNLQIVESDKLSDYPDDFIKEFYNKRPLPLLLEKNLDNSEKSALEIIDTLYKQAMQEV